MSALFTQDYSLGNSPHPNSPPPLPSPRGEGRRERGDRMRGLVVATTFGAFIHARLLTGTQKP